MNAKKLIVIGFVLMGLALALAACAQPTAEATPCPTAEPCPTCPEAPACPECTECPKPVVEDVPFETLWAESGHNNVTGEQFRHWDEDGEVPTSCAKCHTTAGHQDFLGADGSEAGVVDAAVPAVEAQGVQCIACHNDVTLNKTSVVMPSGVEITGLGGEAVCMECHQGRESKVSVDAQLERFGVNVELDKVAEPIVSGETTSRLGFRNIHYFAAAVTLYGGEAMGGYQYEGMVYDSKNQHVPGFDTCIGCHDQHSLEVKVEACAECHEGVTSTEDLKNVRMVSSAHDYDGDGDVEEGMYFEIEGLQETLLATLKEYALAAAGHGITYDAATYPYFLQDDDGDGVGDKNEEGRNVSFSSWTGRLLKAAYNYQVSKKDPGAFAHGNKYIVQLLHDSIADLNEYLGTVDMSAMARDDAGHFAGNTEPFRHWDEEGEVPGTCAKCHSADGLAFFLENGVNIATEPANGFLCITCHNGEAFPEVRTADSVTFPSGKKVSFGEGEAANVCLLCHQGRESKVSVDRTIGTFGDAPDAVALKEDGTGALSFRNIHYFAAGATLFGSEVQGAYLYSDKEYAGQREHPLSKCSDCHDVHALNVKEAACAGCHPGVELYDIRMPNTPDYDGDGNTSEGVKGELDDLSAKLYEAMQAYAETNSVGIVYDAHAYPYFFESDGSTRYTKWTPRLLKAAFNYQYYQKDPGAFTHNPAFVAQFLIDSIEDMGGDISTFTRP